ncbi:MAG TPA: hypothetical protein VLK78_09675 [Candidatus Angelobacter sp.]|nr:hypothetical protein [Candidatus Angelobacter sp.]
MAKSKAKKQRDKWQREGHFNPELNRGTWAGMNPTTKRTPTLIEKQRKVDSKYKKRFTHGDGALDKPFLLFVRSFPNCALLHKNFPSTFISLP